MNFNAGEDTFFQVKKSLSCRGKLLDLSTPKVMGIMNITPDSFYDGNKLNDEKSILSAAEKMLMDGADIIDIGGQSSRPGAERISSEVEWDRIKNTLSLILNKFPETIISVDTFYSDVAARAYDSGASIINDISAGEIDPKMFGFIVKSKMPYIVMHMQGTPATMQVDPRYENVVSEVIEFLRKKVLGLRNSGVTDIIVDPGFGFGKTVEHNFSLLNKLELFQLLGCPVMAGLSRKSMITKSLKIKSADALNGTTVLNTFALMNGAKILRVHDVKEATEVIKLHSLISKLAD